MRRARLRRAGRCGRPGRGAGGALARGRARGMPRRVPGPPSAAPARPPTAPWCARRGAARRSARRDSAPAARQPAAGPLQDRLDAAHRHPVPEHGRVPGRGEPRLVDAQRPQRRRHHRPHRPDRAVEDLEHHRAPVRQRRGEHALRPVLGDQAGHRGGEPDDVPIRCPRPTTGGRAGPSPTRPSGVSGGAVAIRAKARASPAGVLENSGAPQPSTAIRATGTPVRSSTVSRTARCSG